MLIARQLVAFRILERQFSYGLLRIHRTPFPNRNFEIVTSKLPSVYPGQRVFPLISYFLNVEGGKVGIAVLTGAEVKLTNCAIQNCATAILQDSAATLQFGNTQVIRLCKKGNVK